MVTPDEYNAWSLDQLTKSEFFHLKLHEWNLLEIAYQIENVRGENLQWKLKKLGISKTAWDKAIHRAIKPVLIFAHPQIITSITGAVAYYRMLSMVSQKSMNRIGLSTTSYEGKHSTLDYKNALIISKHLNRIISQLVETDDQIDAREFDIWRGMAAGSQAQGSWQNIKGDKIQIIVKSILQRRLREKRLVTQETGDGLNITLKDGRNVIFADEPDVGFYRKERIIAAIEIKGGIDPAGVLERVGAAIKSLRRAKEENPGSATVLILQGISLTDQAKRDLETNKQAVNYWFTIEELLTKDKREEVFIILNI